MFVTALSNTRFRPAQTEKKVSLLPQKRNTTAPKMKRTQNPSRYSSTYIGVLGFHVRVGAVVGRVSVPLEGHLPLAALGAALQLLHLGPEVDVLPQVELLGEAVSAGRM